MSLFSIQKEFTPSIKSPCPTILGGYLQTLGSAGYFKFLSEGSILTGGERQSVWRPFWAVSPCPWLSSLPKYHPFMALWSTWPPCNNGFTWLRRGLLCTGSGTIDLALPESGEHKAVFPYFPRPLDLSSSSHIFLVLFPYFPLSLYPRVLTSKIWFFWKRIDLGRLSLLVWKKSRPPVCFGRIIAVERLNMQRDSSQTDHM